MEMPRVHALVPDRPPLARRPTFLIIGAAKAGTTSLHHYLGQHPQIFLPEVKEPGFYAYDASTPPYRDVTRTAIAREPYAADSAAYEALFQGANGALAVGEASTLYLYEAGAAARIRTALPDVKLVVVLRNPAERAFSHYMHLRRDGREPIDDFARALEAEPARIRERYFPSFHYRAMGRYGEQLARYFERFDRDRILVVLHEELQRAPVKTSQRVQGFLGVDPAFVPDTSLQLNASGLPRSRWLHDFIVRPSAFKTAAARFVPASVRLSLASRLQRANLDRAPRLDPNVRAELLQEFAPDLDRLRGLLDRDLSAWAA